MTRFNYLATSRRPPFAAGFAAVAIDNRIRGPFIALTATIVLTALLSMVQLARLHAAQNAYATASVRIAGEQNALDDVSALRARVFTAKRLSENVAATHRANLVHVNELTWIGNHLPAQTWLHALRYEAGSYSLEGTSDRASTVGTAMLALRDAAHATIPQLVSLHDDGATSSPRVHYFLRVQTLP